MIIMMIMLLVKIMMTMLMMVMMMKTDHVEYLGERYADFDEDGT